MLGGANLYDPLRDPRHNNHRDSGKSTRMAFEEPSKKEANVSDMQIKNESRMTCETMHNAANTQHEDLRTIKLINTKLIAGHDIEVAKLQRKIATLTMELSKESDRFRNMAESHAVMTTSHKKRVDEKTKIIAENAALQSEQATLRDQLADHSKAISDSRVKIFQLEQDKGMLLGKIMSLEKEKEVLEERVVVVGTHGQIKMLALKAENERLQEREKQLEMERDIVHHRVKELESLEEQHQAISAKVLSLDRGRNEATGEDVVQATVSQQFKNGDSGPRKHPRLESFSNGRSNRRKDFRRNLNSDHDSQKDLWAPTGPRGDRRH